MEQGVNQLLYAIYDPQQSLDSKRAAEAQLHAFSKSTDALNWAVNVLAQAGTDGQVLFFAATVLARAVAYRWQQLPLPQQHAIKQCLWESASRPGQPKFATRKLASVLAHLVCLEWPAEFWFGVQDSINNQTGDAHRVETGLILLDATMEQLYSLAQATQAGMRGRVLASNIPAIKERLTQAQPTALSLLFQTATRQDLDVSLRSYALEIFRRVMSDAPGLGASSQTQAQDLITALSSIIIDTLASSSSSQTAAANSMLLPSMGCLCDVLAKLRGTPALQEAIEQLCSSVESLAKWLPTGFASNAAAAGEVDVECKVGYVRLLVQCLSVLLGCSGLGPRVHSTIHTVLQAADHTIHTTSSSTDFLLLLEIWHTVLEHLERLDDDDIWLPNVADSPNKTSNDGLQSMLTESTLRVVGSVLTTLFDRNTAGISLPLLATDRGSGSTLDDALAALTSSSEEATDQAALDASALEDDNDFGGCGSHHHNNRNGHNNGGGLAFDSELCVYLRYAETFLVRAINSFTKELVPLVVNHFRAQTQGLLQQAHHSGIAAAASNVDLLLSVIRTDMSLKLVGRCGPSLNRASNNNNSNGHERGSTLGPAVDVIRQGIHLATCWLELQVALVQNPQQGGTWDVTCATLSQLGCQVHRSLGAMTSSWLPHILLSPLIKEPSNQEAIAVLLVEEFASIGQALQALCQPPLSQAAGNMSSVAVAVAQQALSLSSIALSSGMRPPECVLKVVLNCPGFQNMSAAASQGCHGPGILPSRAIHMLWPAASDLTLRNWSPILTTDTALQEQASTFRQLVQPLVKSFPATQQALQNLDHTPVQGVVDTVCELQLCVGAVTAIVQSYSGSKKTIRAIVHTSLIMPVFTHTLNILPQLIALLSSGAHQHNSEDLQKACRGTVSALLRMISASLEALPTELSVEDTETLFRAVFQAFLSSPSTTGLGAIETEEQLVALLVTVLSRGGNKHQGLVPPTLQFCMDCWGRIDAVGGGLSREVAHAKTNFLAASLSLLRHYWRLFAGNEQQRLPGGEAVITQVLSMVQAYFKSASSGGEVLAASDVRLILEEMYDLQCVSKIYSHQLFLPFKGELAESLLLILLGRLHTAVQEGISDTLYALAASNWSEFLLTFLPAFAERHLGGGAKAAMVGGGALGGLGDISVNDWETKLLALINDVWFYQQAM